MVRTRVDVDDELSVYNRVAKRVARVFVVGKVKATKLTVGIVAVNLTVIPGRKLRMDRATTFVEDAPGNTSGLTCSYPFG